MTQILRCAEVHHVEITSTKMKVTGLILGTGSQLAKTQEGWIDEVSIDLDMQSPRDAAEVAEMIRPGENTCYTTQALKRPVDVKLNVSLNGNALEV